MKIKLRKYNPALLSDTQLIDQFVARKNDLQILLKTIRENTGRPSNQHIMFIGPRGMGKTTLVLRAMADVRREKAFDEAWYPIVMAEESYMVGSAAEFWLEAVLRLAEIRKDTDLEKIHDELLNETDNKILYDKALDVLLEFADSLGKRLIIVAESFNMLFDEQLKDSEGWILRETLINEPRIMLVATATSRFDQIDNIRQPMFELFAVRELQSLALADCLRIWRLVTGNDVGERQIRPIEILTGGNPRLLVILSSFAANSSLKELIEDLIALIDDHTDYLKSNTESLPPLERKAFVALADIWEPATAREVGKATRMDVNQASTQLTRLVKRGAVVVQKKEGRKQYYQLAERLYNIYHQLRRRGNQSNRVRTAVKFMIDYYEERELCYMVEAISAESLDLPPDEREDHFEALEQIVAAHDESKIRERLIGYIHPKVFECADSPPGLKILQDEIEYKNDVSDSETKQIQRMTLLVGLIKKDTGIIENALARAYENLEKKHTYLTRFGKIYFDSASESKYKSIDLDEVGAAKVISQALLELGVAFNNNEQDKAAEQVNRKIIDLEPENAHAWNNLSVALLNQKQYEEAEQACRKAIKLDIEYVHAYYNLGNTLYPRRQNEEAEQAYRKAIELNPEYTHAWNGLGIVLGNLEQAKEAEQAFRKVIELDPKYIHAWNGLGLQLKNQRRYDEAENAYRKAIKLDPEYVYAWNGLGIVLENQDRIKEAEQAYRKAIEIDQAYGDTYSNLGHLLQLQKRDEEAEHISRKAIELCSKNANVWNLRGAVLAKRKRYTEAENAYRKAIELDDEFHPAFCNLGDVLNNQNRFEEAEEAYKKAIELNGGLFYALGQLSTLYTDHGKYEKAENICRKKLNFEYKIDSSGYMIGYSLFLLGMFDKSFQILENIIAEKPEEGVFHNNMGYILLFRGQADEARKHFEKALSLDQEQTSLYYANLGISLSDLGEKNESAKYFKKTVKLILKKGADPPVLNSMARLCIKLGMKKQYKKAEKWARQARYKKPYNSEYAFTLASILAAQKRWKSALEPMGVFLKNPGFARHFTPDVIDFFIGAAVAGFAGESLEILSNSPSAGHLEPLVVALRKYLGKQTNAPLEVYEVAKDIVVEINQRKP